MLKKLRQALDKAAQELMELIGDEKKYAEKKAEITEIEAQIERAKEALSLQANLAAQNAGPGPSSEMSRSGDFQQILRHPRSGRLKNFQGEHAEVRALRFGKFMLASVYGSTAAKAWCEGNGIELKVQTEGVNNAGGVLVPEEFTNEIIDLRDAYGLFRRYCRNMPMGRDTMNQPRRTGGLIAYPVGEGKAIQESNASWDNVKLTANKWGVLVPFSTELDEDAAINIGDYLLGEIAYAFAVAEDGCGWSGDGSSSYHNITGFIPKFENSATLAGAVAAATGHDTFAEIDANDLSLMMGKLPQYVYQRGRPAWYCSQMGWAMVFQRIIQGAGGISKDDATGRVVFQYLGFPVEISPSLPTAVTALNNKAMLFFGDIGMAASFGDRRGMTVKRSEDHKFAEDQIVLRATERFDINVHDVGDATVAGPVVALIGKT
ncbi:MAG: phage major capsid protein [Alphaproteobacteria bacterium]|nr:phage major capsid protein [Alphaproteobacteria bacterium]